MIPLFAIMIAFGFVCLCFLFADVVLGPVVDYMTDRQFERDVEELKARKLAKRSEQE